MIEVDISDVWGQVSLPDLLALEAETAAAHQTLMEGTGAGAAFRGWLKSQCLPEQQLERILASAEKIREDSQVCVVAGSDGACLGARGAIELLQGPHRNLSRSKGDPQILFAGNSFSTRQWNELARLLEGKDFSVIVISKSGQSLEPAVAFRALRWMLERKYGTDEANNRIYAITDPEKGPLRRMADEALWESFEIPPDVTSAYAVLSTAGLLPMAVAGIDIRQVLQGAADGREAWDLRSYENPVWLYTAVRSLLYRRGKKIEVLESFEPGFQQMGAWWQQLMAGSGGKDGRGLFPAAAALTADLHSLGQLIQDGERNLFETMLRFDPPAQKQVIIGDVKNLDELNGLEGLTLDRVEEMAWMGAVSAHTDGGVPVIHIHCGELNPRKVGELFWFFQLSGCISAYMLGVDPFDQPGLGEYTQKLGQLLAGSRGHAAP